MQFGVDSLPNTYYRVSIKTLVFDADHKLLVSKNREGEWEMPGGGLDHGETVEACAARELAEELQATVTSFDGIAFCYPGLTNHGKPKLNVAVKVQIQDGTLTPTDDDLVEARYVTREELLELPFQKGEAFVKEYVDRIWSNT
jgi:8-oxo-dGTP pyrophosphatase MutT (NUDIX family)